MWQATGPAIALLLALGFAAIAKSRLLSQILGAPVSGWRWPLIWAAAAAAVVGQLAILLPEWAELLFGIPAILLAFGRCCGSSGFGPEDRELFRMRKDDIEELSAARSGDERRRAALSRLVAEVPHPGEQHRQPGLVGGGDDFVVADRAAGLDHRRGAGLDRRQQARRRTGRRRRTRPPSRPCAVRPSHWSRPPRAP